MFELIRANKIKSGILIVVLTMLLVVLGGVIGQASMPVADGSGAGVGLAIALVVGLVMTLVAYFGGSSIMLTMSGAKEIEKKDNPQLFNVVEEISIAAGLPMPKVYIIDDTALNAFATGRNPKSASVAITKGLLMKLNRDELQGVIAHEMSHVKNRDILFMTLAGVLLGTIVLLADLFLRSRFYSGSGYRRRSSSDSKEGGGAQAVILVIAILLAILGPIIARLLYLACSRRREYLADASGALLTRYPDGLASALEKIDRDREPLEVANRATAPMFIVNPIQALHAGAAGLFSTHPPTQERIAILRGMGRSASLSTYQQAWNKFHAGEKLVPASGLAAAAPLPARAPSQEAGEETPEQRLERAHDALDTVRRLGGFLFLPCACGSLLKIPPAYTRPEVRCPRCGATHLMTEAKPAAAGSPPTLPEA